MRYVYRDAYRRITVRDSLHTAHKDAALGGRRRCKSRDDYLLLTGTPISTRRR